MSLKLYIFWKITCDFTFTEPHCNGWGQRGLVDSAHAWVAPVTSNGYQLDEVEVYCDMDSHNGTGVTVIGKNTYIVLITITVWFIDLFVYEHVGFAPSTSSMQFGNV